MGMVFSSCHIYVKDESLLQKVYRSRCWVQADGGWRRSRDGKICKICAKYTSFDKGNVTSVMAKLGPEKK